jgi:hypothetical protein
VRGGGRAWGGGGVCGGHVYVMEKLAPELAPDGNGKVGIARDGGAIRPLLRPSKSMLTGTARGKAGKRETH